MIPFLKNPSWFCVLLLTWQLSEACTPGLTQDFDYREAVLRNLEHRDASNIAPRSGKKTAITNVSVFNGNKMLSPRTVVIDRGVIVKDAAGAEHIDGSGHTLLPGLIDNHAHPDNVTHLQDMTRFGITTAFLMSCPVPELCASLRHHAGLVDIHTGSLPGAALDSFFGTLLGLNASTAIANTSYAEPWVRKQIANGAEFIKLIAQAPGLSQDILTAATRASHNRKKEVVCHAPDTGSVERCMIASVDQIHHVPLDKTLGLNVARGIRQRSMVSVPTLTVMLGLSQALGPESSFAAANSSVALLHLLGVPILAGTDANVQAGAPANVLFGSSIHQELELLVQAGLSPVDALRAATSLPARFWDLKDRGVIEVGRRADVLLVEGNPTKNISATRNIRKLWIAGREFEGRLGG